MMIKGMFDQSQTQVFHESFEVNKATSIHFELLEGAFEHFFVVVKDPTAKIRALFTFKTRQKQYVLSKSFTTSDNYTECGAIDDGTWSLDVVRTYPITGGFSINIAFDLGTQATDALSVMHQDFEHLYDEREGWYRGDFHVHSEYSDGRVPQSHIIEVAKHKSLDFLSMSEHSTNTTKFPVTNMPIIPATEITWDDNGHYNVHGMHTFIDYADIITRTTNKDEALDMMFKDLRKQSAVLSINHPFALGISLTHHFDIRSFQLLEVMNAPHLLDKEVNNEKAIRFFDYLWTQGHYLYGIGGSDAHKKNYFDQYPLAIPLTKVYCKGLSIQNIIQAIAAGNAMMQSYEECEVRIRQDGRLMLPGSRVHGKVDITARCETNITWQLYKNGQMVDRKTAKQYTCEFIVDTNEFYRLQASVNGETLCFINPIHNMQNEATIFDFHELVLNFEEIERNKTNEKNDN